MVIQLLSLFNNRVKGTCTVQDQSVSQGIVCGLMLLQEISITVVDRITSGKQSNPPSSHQRCSLLATAAQPIN